MNKKKWTYEEICYLEKHYPSDKTEDVARHLNRPVSSVHNKVFALQLKKTAAFKKAMVSKEFLEAGRRSRFAPGVEVWNKGMKGLQIGGKQTQFKKGNIPHNARHDGATRLDKDGFIMIRVSLGHWRPLHHVVWEQAGNKILENHIISFKDGNNKNCDISNLEMISRAENMKRNTIHRYPKEIKDTLRVLSKLKKTIKSYEEQN